MRRQHARNNPDRLAPSGFELTVADTLTQAHAAFDAGDMATAERLYRRILDGNPDNFDALHALAVLAARCGRPEEAHPLLRRALEINPQSARAHANEGNVLQALGMQPEALASYDRALAQRPDFADALGNRALTLLELGRDAEALASCDLAISIDPHHVGAWTNRGVVLNELARHDEALSCFDKALSIRPAAVQVLVNRGNTLQTLRRHAEALENYARAIALAPDFAEAHYYEGLARLAQGQLARGWQKHEWRWKRKGQRMSQASQAPFWRGDAPLAGRTILAQAEQGQGDTIQFCRYADLLADAGARVVLEVQAPLKALVSTLRAQPVVVCHGEALPDHDVRCPLLSLPLSFGTELETIPGTVPYLFAPPEKARHWEARLAAGHALRVGLVCSGNPTHRNDRHRSIPLANFRPILNRGLDLFLLQNEIRLADEAFLQATAGIACFAKELADFSDTAALVANMDVVVSVDSAVAHLAGALGKPVWILLPFTRTDWRWLQDRESSPWYPTARLFRQPAAGDWDTVIERVAHELSVLRETLR
jgi:tetratricopeptide (TPR) repeat protein